MKAAPRAVVVLGAILVAGGAQGQSAAKPWEFSASVSYYDVPKSQDYWNPIFTADRGRLHLEARHNYVAIGTSSLWAGVNFSARTRWTFDATLMFGIVAGSVDGVEVGYELSLGRAWFALSSQGEYVFDVREHDDSALYSWTELTGSPVDWCRLGVALQRTKAYVTSRAIQRGVVAAFGAKHLEFEIDALDPDRDDATYILSLTVSF